MPKRVPQSIFEYVQSLNALEFHTKIDKISQFLLGIPYTSSSKSQAPIYHQKEQISEWGTELSTLHASHFSFKSLDCVTFTESVLALSYTDTSRVNTIDEFTQDFQLKLDSIRYKNGIDSFFNRNHFISADWLPNNKLLFSDITANLSTEYQVAVANINRLSWVYKTQVENKFLDEARPTLEEVDAVLLENGITLTPQEANLNYIPVNDFLEHYHEFVLDFPEEATIVNIVRPGWDLVEAIGTELNVSHQGFVFKKYDEETFDPTLLFRHATSIDPKEVVELPFDEYIQRYQNQTPEIGLNFLSISALNMSMHLEQQRQLRESILPETSDLPQLEPLECLVV